MHLSSDRVFIGESTSREVFILADTNVIMITITYSEPRGIGAMTRCIDP